jgi:hypothetical protein
MNSNPSTLGGRERRISEFKASLVYRVSSRTARGTQKNPVSKKKNYSPGRPHPQDLRSSPYRQPKRLHSPKTRKSNRNQGMKHPLNKDKIRYHHLELQSSQIQMAKLQCKNRINYCQDTVFTTASPHASACLEYSNI